MSKKKTPRSFGKKLLKLMYGYKKLRVEGISQVLVSELLMMWVIAVKDKQDAVHAVLRQVQESANDQGIALVLDLKKPTIH